VKDDRPEQIYMEKHDVCLAMNSEGQYYPFTYKNSKGDWIAIAEGDPIFDFMIYISKVMGNDVNPVTGKRVINNLYNFQWGMAINIINVMLGYETKFFTVEISRQSGKTTVLEYVQSFLTVFGRRYKTNLKGGKWTTVTLSHKEDSVKKNFVGLRKGIKKAVEIYNDLYCTPQHKLVYGKYTLESGENKQTTDTESLLRIDCVIDVNKSVEWSEIFALSANISSDGLSACCITSDESILIDAKLFMRSILPFASANGGSIVCTGIASVNSACLQYAVHNMEESIKIIYTCDDVYRMLKVCDPKQAEIYKNSVETQIQACGGKDSTEAQTNYYMSWEVTEGKFTTRTQLKKNKVYEAVLGDINYNADYVVAGLDLSLGGDYVVMTIGEVYKEAYVASPYGTQELQSGYKHYLKDLKTYNFDRQRMDANELAKRTAKYCKEYKIDMICIDSTSNQGTQVQLIYEAILKEGINTLVIPFNFAGTANKVIMMGYVESVLFSGRCKLPLEEYKNSNKSYEVFLREILALLKYKSDSNLNVQYKAPKGFTDDHFFSFCLMVYAVPHVEILINKNKLIEIGTKKIFPRLNKFKLLSDIKTKPITIESYIGGLF